MKQPRYQSIHIVGRGEVNGVASLKAIPSSTSPHYGDSFHRAVSETAPLLASLRQRGFTGPLMYKYRAKEEKGQEKSGVFRKPKNGSPDLFLILVLRD
jgi:hypothetical protein